MMDIIDVAKQIKDEEAQNIVDNPENFPLDWVLHAKARLMFGGGG